MKSFYLEGYGCSLNLGETQSVAGFLRSKGFLQVVSPNKASFLIINTCSVKQATEQRMVWRIKYLLQKKKKSAKLFVMGCFAAAQAESIKKIGGGVFVLDNRLSSLCGALGLPRVEFSPEIVPVKSKEWISIVPVSTGCMGSCTYCSARLARKSLSSYPVKSIVSAVRNALGGDEVNSPSKEIWLTSQDLGCYGVDMGSSLPALLEEILKIGGEYRLRLGMMNPNHFKKIKSDLLGLMGDERVYKFLHLPVQSGSNRILRLMNRGYSVKDFVECIDFARSVFPDITIATDVIVGFPTETEKDFSKTLELLSKINPDIVNISRFGKRKGTFAQEMALQVPEFVKKERSRELTVFCDALFAKKNSHFLGKEVSCLVSERTKNGFNARTNNYLTVFVKKGFGKFVRARVTAIRAHYLLGEVV